MSRSWRHLVFLLLASLLYLSGCTSPVVYRPEVEGFHKATAEMSAFLEAKRTAVRDIRDELRTEALTASRPLLALSDGCREAIADFNRLSDSDASPPLAPSDVAECQLQPALADEGGGDLARLLNPLPVLDDSAAFAEAVAEYAESLQKIATAGDRASFVEAVDGLASSTRSLAVSAAEAAGNEPPDVEALTPIARLIGLAASFALEERRASALKDAAATAHPWIEQGSAAVARALFAAQAEIVLAKREALLEQVDEVNEASPSAYVAAADEAVAMAADLRRALAADPGAPFRVLPVAHEKLREAFEDRERLVPGALAASKELLEAARAAREALVEDR